MGCSLAPWMKLLTGGDDSSRESLSTNEASCVLSAKAAYLPPLTQTQRKHDKVPIVH